jgi:thiol-disulfide isomerase/thioredoxin
MNMKKASLIFILVVYQFNALAQKNFIVVPAKPQAGSVLQIEYTPAGELANTLGTVEASVFMNGKDGREGDDLPLTKSGKKYLAKIPTDTSIKFIQLAFYVNDKFDNNNNNGYYIQLYKGDKIKKGSYAQLATLYQFFGHDSGVDKDETKAFAAFEKEFELYPEQKKPLALNYYRLFSTVKGDALPLIQKDIDNAVKAGLKTEDDYIFLNRLYVVGKFTEEAQQLKKSWLEKFPNGDFAKDALVEKYQNTKDTVEKEMLYTELEKKIKTQPEWKNFQWVVDNHSTMKAAKFAKRRDWANYKAALNEIENKKMISTNYNSMAWNLQEKNQDLAVAEGLAKWAADFSQKERNQPSTPKPKYLTSKQWQKSRETDYAMSADTYAMVLYKVGKNKEGFALAKAAAIDLRKGEDSDLNTTYALLAEKELAPAEAKKQFEKFVKEGHSSTPINNILKKMYISEGGKEEGFEKYLADLSHEVYLKMLEELKKSMTKEQAPTLALKDLQGNNVNISDLKGKVVVIDFWATWCGPCKASFPAMQKVVTKYRSNDNVKFVFVDTWERSDNKEKNASEFIASNKYTFDVWMDNESQLVEKFKVDGIPTKFVLDKEGNIRFKSVGFSGSDEKLMSELGAMIDLAGGEKPTANPN